jgi:hypothetical protein
MPGKPRPGIAHRRTNNPARQHRVPSRSSRPSVKPPLCNPPPSLGRPPRPTKQAGTAPPTTQITRKRAAQRPLCSLRSRMHFPFPGNGRFFTSSCYFRASDEKFRPPCNGETDRNRHAIRATANPCDPFRSPRSGPYAACAAGCISGDAGTCNTMAMESPIMKQTIALLPDNVRENQNRRAATGLLPAPGRPQPSRPPALRVAQSLASAPASAWSTGRFPPFVPPLQFQIQF